MKRRVVLLLTTMAVVLMMSSWVALAATISCEFSSSTSECWGTDDPDVLYGTPYQDYMSGKGGSDELYGREAVNGLNRLHGEDYNGDPSKDGDDRVIGGPDPDVLEWSFGGDDVLRGYRGMDTIIAVEEDTYQGQTFRPTANPGVDAVYGGGAHDYIYAVDGYKDRIDCGPNSKDEVYFDEGLDEVANCEDLHPS